ncbi:hypothetical protein Lal_00028335 [Lupinus albus]|nr:hypothetical protein Lal_00028335 [Lupinus albus]
MKIISVAFRSLNSGLSNRVHQTQTHLLRSFSSWSFSDNGAVKPQTNKSESHEDFEKRIFGEIPGSDSKTDAFFDKLNRLSRTHDRSSSVDGGNSQMMNDLEDSFDTLSDGMDGKLKNAATYFEFDPEELIKDDYAFRYDTDFYPGSTYTIKIHKSTEALTDFDAGCNMSIDFDARCNTRIGRDAGCDMGIDLDTRVWHRYWLALHKDLDLTKPGVHKPAIRPEFKVTTKEVLSQADFRNVRFLANFITEAGILIKRSKTGISAKAQRKVAREVKTARAFGLMPFTTMGTKSFVYGVTMESLDKDFAYASVDRNMHDDLDM